MKIGNKKITKFSIALLVIAALVSLVLAQVYLYSIQTTWHITVKSTGSFVLYNVGLSTPFNDFTFPEFTGLATVNKTFDIVSTANAPIGISWNTTSVGWNTGGSAGYTYGTPTILTIRFFYAGSALNYDTRSSTLAVGARVTCALRVECNLNQAVDLDLVVKLNSEV